LADLNRRACRGEPVPALTVCTGRSGAYVDAILQVLSGFLPAVCENGAGLFFRDRLRLVPHPRLPTGLMAALREVRAGAEVRIVAPGLATLQTGQELSLTFLPTPGHDWAEVANLAYELLDGRGLPLRVERVNWTVCIWPEGLDKGDGVRWLAEETGIPLERMAGMGDSPNDLAFLRLLGLSAAPANAAPEVRAAVDYGSPHAYGRGLLDLVSRIDGIQRRST
jgi:hypothetical protein